MDFYDVLIVGAGHAGAQAAASLRQLKFEGSIGLLGDEFQLPYNRPPLSKEYMAGDKTFSQILLRADNFWEDCNIDVLLKQRVTVVKAEDHRVVTAGGHVFKYGKLIWATGGRPRQLSCPGSGAEGVCAIRCRGDADYIIERLENINNVVIIGGGYIGLEAAAVMTRLGKKVTVLEAVDRVLSRVAGEPLSRFYESEHRRHGVDVRTGVTVESIAEENGKARGVVLDDGEIIPADLVIVGIGIIPDIEPLVNAGAKSSNGVEVDGFCRTSLIDIYAVGDCAAHYNRYAGGIQIRLESVQNANDQAKTAVQHMLGQGGEYDAVPWFWSNQYDLRLQTVGLSTGHDQVILRGNPEDRKFSVVYLKAGKFLALDAVNSPAEFVQAKVHVFSESVLDQEKLANPSLSLKDMNV